MPEDVAIRRLSTPEEMVMLEELQRLVWPSSDVDIVPGHIMLAIAHHGGVVLGAFERGELVGFVLGFLGTDGGSSHDLAMTKLIHCSHQLGVHPEYRQRGLGYRLKVAQRDFVLGQGVRLIVWTYDPLLGLNANLNVRRLGVIARTYIREAYGEMRDGLNVGLPSDRLQVEWWITSERVKTRLSGSRQDLDFAHYKAAGAERMNETSLDREGLLHVESLNLESWSTFLLLEIPPDFQLLRSEQPALAHEWRLHTREALEEAFGLGYIITDFIHFKEEKLPRSFYVLSQGEKTLG
jgi:predicted GNAT superfamily acetyltransferase